MKILVCGGAGFIGSAFIKNHLKSFPEDKIVNMDNLSIGGNIRNLDEIVDNQNHHFIKSDIRNQKIINDNVKDNDLVVNFAAETHVDRSIANPTSFVETNVLGTLSILEAVRSYDKMLVHISTDELYGEAKNNTSFKEAAPLNPTNPYSASKASADHLVLAYHKTYGIKCIITRSSNNFGPFQFPEKLIPKAVIRAIKNFRVPLYGDGNQIRSWIYVLDHVMAIEQLISKGKSGEIYNITAWNEISNKTVVEKILQLLNKSTNFIEFVEDRPGHDKHYSIDASKIQKDTNWKPKYAFEQALQETVDWYVNNKKWWEPLINEKILHPTPWNLKW